MNIFDNHTHWWTHIFRKRQLAEWSGISPEADLSSEVVKGHFWVHDCQIPVVWHYILPYISIPYVDTFADAIKQVVETFMVFMTHVWVCADWGDSVWITTLGSWVTACNFILSEPACCGGNDTGQTTIWWDSVSFVAHRGEVTSTCRAGVGWRSTGRGYPPHMSS